jgi:hypothetical protein
LPLLTSTNALRCTKQNKMLLVTIMMVPPPQEGTKEDLHQVTEHGTSTRRRRVWRPEASMVREDVIVD